SCQSPGTLESGVTLYASQGVDIVSTMAPLDGHTHSPFIAGAAQNPTTTLSANVVEGSQTLVVVSAAGIVAGTTYLVVGVANSSTLSYKVTNVAGTTLTIDRPIPFGYPAGSSVLTFAAGPTRDVRLSMGG